MPIKNSDIAIRPAKLNSSATPAQNGGAIDFTKAVVSGVKNNIFPDASQSERLSGSSLLKKMFVHVGSTALLALQNTRVFMDAMSPGEDYFLLYPGTSTDTQDQITSRPYGIGSLTQNLAAGDQTFDILVEDIALYTDEEPFRIGDVIRVADRPTLGGTGGEEFATLTAVEYKADRVAVTVAVPLDNPYPMAGTLVSGVWEPGDIVASVSNIAVTSAAGTFNPVNSITPSNKGTVEQVWTVTFQSATAYTVKGDTVKNGVSVGSGSLVSDLTVNNPDTAAPYFTIKANAFGGTFQAGDTITFRTHPAAIGYWYKRIIPAGAASISNNFTSIGVQGESA